MSKPKPRTKELKTLPDLVAALEGLVEGKREASATKHVYQRYKKGHRSVSEFFSGDLDWHLPESRGGLLNVHELGDTLEEVFEACKAALRLELEERGRLRRLEVTEAEPARLSRPVQLLPAPQKRLEYMP